MGPISVAFELCENNVIKWSLVFVTVPIGSIRVRLRTSAGIGFLHTAPIDVNNRMMEEYMRSKQTYHMIET
ncbi:hypothetical protein RB195_002730 [Necator americanus]|uniref:Uncharacterized protein n=1 Tax=Necator americanus TaxID=51031 RepID=A0ABR1DKV3_NECAM